jgi:hypothetical protein
MKKIFLTLLFLIIASSSYAYPYYHGHYEYRGGGWVWVVPAIVGGVIGYEIAQPRQPNVVIIQQPTNTVTQTSQTEKCSPWAEIKNTDGTVTRTRTCTSQ